jgi:DNA processing protein
MSDLDELYAIALSRFKESKRYQATQAVVAAGSFDPVKSCFSGADLQLAREISDKCRELKLLLLPITSKRYPDQLREISAPPSLLYVHTLNSEMEFPQAALGIVGTRAASIDVCSRASEISTTIALAGITVVSGLALGIDGAAHRGALKSAIECPTIAVLAHGLDRVYPPTHIGLAREILDLGGAIVSEYAPGVEPMKHHFLARNRIIAGLSKGVVVVQAGARSGSLVTANFAADYGRDVFIVQYASDDERSLGGSAMIEQGAIAVSSAADILREYDIVVDQKANRDPSSWITMNFESFMTVTSLSSGEVLKLELEGHLMRLPGNQVRVSRQVLQ